MHGPHSRTTQTGRRAGHPWAPGSAHRGLTGTNRGPKDRLPRSRRTRRSSRSRSCRNWRACRKTHLRPLLLQPLNHIRPWRHDRPGYWLPSQWWARRGSSWRNRRAWCKGRTRRRRPRGNGRSRSGSGRSASRGYYMGWRLRRLGRCGQRSAGRCSGSWNCWAACRHRLF